MGHLEGLRLDGFAKFNAPAWLPRRWKSPDPLKDSQARQLDWGLRVRSLSDMIEEDGADPEEVFERIALDKARLDKLKISPTIPSGLQFDDDDDAATATG